MSTTRHLRPWRLGAVAIAAIAAGVPVACSLNPQPLPPGGELGASDVGEGDAAASFSPNDGGSRPSPEPPAEAGVGGGFDAAGDPPDAGADAARDPDAGDAGDDAAADAGDAG